MRVGVVGVGHLGQHHARLYTEIDGVELVGVADAGAERAREVANRHGVQAWDDARVLIGRVDAASVATPTETHLKVASMLLENGIHVLVEKPIAPDVESARTLCALARQHGRKLQVGHIERFNPAVQAVKTELTDPRFISCDRVSPFSFRSADIGVVLDLMIHDLDIVLHLIKGEVEHVEAMGIPVLAPTEDVAHARLRFANGAVALLTASRVSIKKERKVRIFQRDRYVSLDYGKKSAQTYKLQPGFHLGEADLSVDTSLPPEALQALVFSKYLKVSEASMEGNALKLELESFCRSIREDLTPEVTGEDGLRALEVADRIRESLEAYLVREKKHWG
ncbi:MAG: Gfo/Idh/MocA family oxidoreductase [Planctomycetota bacterium]